MPYVSINSATNVITCAIFRLKKMWRPTKAMAEMKCEHWKKRWNWSSCTKLALSASWTHGLIAQSFRASYQAMNFYIYAIMKTMWSPGYQHNDFVIIHPLVQMMYLHHVSKCMSCHKATESVAVITVRAYCFHVWIIMELQWNYYINLFNLQKK